MIAHNIVAQLHPETDMVRIGPPNNPQAGAIVAFDTNGEPQRLQLYDPEPSYECLGSELSATIAAHPSDTGFGEYGSARMSFERIESGARVRIPLAASWQGGGYRFGFYFDERYGVRTEYFGSRRTLPTCPPSG